VKLYHGTTEKIGGRFVTVLEVPPVDSTETAVQVQIIKDVKGQGWMI